MCSACMAGTCTAHGPNAKPQRIVMVPVQPTMRTARGVEWWLAPILFAWALWHGRHARYMLYRPYGVYCPTCCARAPLTGRSRA